MSLSENSNGLVMPVGPMYGGGSGGFGWANYKDGIIYTTVEYDETVVTISDILPFKQKEFIKEIDGKKVRICCITGR